MQVIFLKDVPRVGKRHDVKEINDGYARNFLFPRGLAKLANTQNLAELERSQKEIVVKREVQEGLLIKNLEEIKNKIITVKAKANDKGHLFSAIHKKEIIELMQKENKVELSEEVIKLDKPIKETGEFEIPIEIKNKKSSFKLKIEKL